MGKGETTHQLCPEPCTDAAFAYIKNQSVMAFSSPGAPSVMIAGSEERVFHQSQHLVVVPSEVKPMSRKPAGKSAFIAITATSMPSAKPAVAIRSIRTSGFSERNLPLNSAHDTLIIAEEDLYLSSVSSADKSLLLKLGDDLPNEVATSRSQLKAALSSPRGKKNQEALPLIFKHYSAIGKVNGEAHIRKCPGGRPSSGGGGGGSNSGGGWGESSVSATGGSGGSFSSSLVTGFGYGAGSGDDDDPWKHQRQVEHTPGHYLDYEDIEGLNLGDSFDPFAYLTYEDQIALARQGANLLSPQATPALVDHGTRFNLDVTGGPLPPISGDISDSTFSDQAPATPMSLMPATPMSHMPATPMSLMPATPGTPSGIINTPIPVQTPTPDRNSDIGELFDINRLMMNRTAPVPKASPCPQPTYQPFHTSPQPMLPIHSEPTRESPASDPNPEDFFRLATFNRSKDRVIEVSVNPLLPEETRLLAGKALFHSHALCVQYQEFVEKQCNLRVAMQTKARICNFSLDTQRKKLVFTMPESCIRIEDWLEQNAASCDIRDCQLILQQVVNTLATLFQSSDPTVSFWGSFQVWVAKNMQVYLFIDCSSSLAVQKVKDIRILSQLYEKVLKPFIGRAFNWVSPQLREVFITFEQLLSNPTGCVSQMALVAQLLGERRVCKLTVQLTRDNILGLPYVVYCLEQEAVADALENIKAMLPRTQRMWTVCWDREGCIPVVRHAMAVASQALYHNHFILLPHPDGQACHPNILYLATSD